MMMMMRRRLYITQYCSGVARISKKEVGDKWKNILKCLLVLILRYDIPYYIFQNLHLSDNFKILSELLILQSHSFYI